MKQLPPYHIACAGKGKRQRLLALLFVVGNHCKRTFLQAPLLVDVVETAILPRRTATGTCAEVKGLEYSMRGVYI
jgi:hypothetical protein